MVLDFNLIASVFMVGFMVAVFSTAFTFRLRLLKHFDEMCDKNQTKDTLRDIRNIEGYIFQIDTTLIQLCAATSILLAIIFF